MGKENRHLIKTREKSPSEVDEFYQWLDDNFIDASYVGDRAYLIEGDGDATLVKLFWGE
jgi:hypothetical protein